MKSWGAWGGPVVGKRSPNGASNEPGSAANPQLLPGGPAQVVDGVSDLGIKQSWGQRMDALDRLLGGNGRAGSVGSSVAFFDDDPTVPYVMSPYDRDRMSDFLHGALGSGAAWLIQPIKNGGRRTEAVP